MSTHTQRSVWWLRIETRAKSVVPRMTGLFPTTRLWVRRPLALLFVACAARPAIGQPASVGLADAQRMLDRFDEQVFSANMRYRIEMRVLEGQTVLRSYSMLVFKRGPRLRLEFEAPAVERGRRMLNDGSGLWMYLPRTGMSLRLAARQAFMGSDASNQDLLRLSLRDDYRIDDVLIVPSPPGVGGDSSIKVRLVAKEARQLFARVDLYTSRDGRLPQLQDFTTGNGRSLRRLRYENFSSVDGAPFPLTVVIDNPLLPERRTVLVYREVRRGDVPGEEFFTLAALRR